MKQPKRPDRSALPSSDGDGLSLAELKARRSAQKEYARRIETLKMRIFRVTEQHTERVVRLVRRWLSDNEK
jgi:flagellar biosynthesis/type III secretory pathway M-ring protein FliF/YscJ